jgi:transmembrane sensor
MSTARDIDARAAEWIERRHFGQWNEDDQSQLEAWLAEAIANRVAYVRLNSSWQRTGRLAALRGAAPETPKAAPLQQTPHPFRFLPRIAAGFAIVAAVSAGVAYYAVRDNTTTYATTVGGREILSLADGSQIELNTDTVLRVSNRTGAREVWLDKGEAYFRIVHDAARPFTVTAQGRRITDLGTEFTVRQEAGRLKIAVLEGRVQVEESANKSPVLTAGDTAIATRETVSVSRKATRKLSTELAWRRGMIVFDNVTLGQAAAEFNRYNRTQIVIADPAVARMKIAGTFPINGVKGFSDLTRHVLGLRVETHGQEISISR